MQMWNLYRDPSGTRLIDVRHSSGHSEQQTTNEICATVITHIDRSVSEKVDHLSAEVKELKNMLDIKNERIKELKNMLDIKNERIKELEAKIEAKE